MRTALLTGAFFVCLLFQSNLASSQQVQHFLKVKIEDSGEVITALQADFGLPVPLEANKVTSDAVVASPFLACQPLNHTQQHKVKGKFVIVGRGDCTFLQKALHLQDSGARGMIVINTENELLQIGARHDDEGELSQTNLSLMSLAVTHKDGEMLLDQMPSRIVVWRLIQVAYDPSLMLMGMLAVSVVALGAYYASEPERIKKKARQAGRPVPSHIVQELGRIEYMDSQSALAFILVASVGLVAMFFFMSKLIYVVFFIFSTGAAQAIYSLLQAATPAVSCGPIDSCHIPLLGTCHVRALLNGSLAIALVVWWLIVRNEKYAWLLQDLLSVCLLLLLQRQLRLPNIKVSTVLLLAAFFYDIFWVFLSPLLFEKSVMVTVATGGNTGEAVPMLLRLPHLAAQDGGYTMLGLGDVALPGLLVSFLLRFDLSNDLPKTSGYFLCSLCGYAVGIALTDLALFVFETGQPALLYLVPSTLGSTLLLAHHRGHLGVMWKDGMQANTTEEHEQLVLVVRQADGETEPNERSEAEQSK
eukprot:g51828.t1